MSKSPERRMVLNLYISPEFKETKSINAIINNSIKNSNNAYGATSKASTYVFPDGNRYIVRETPGGYQYAFRIKNELNIYRLLKSDPDYKNYISNLVYADIYLAAGKRKSYFVFQYEDGTSLNEFIEAFKGKLNSTQVLRIYNQLKTAVDFLASHDVVHRDIKPENIFYSYDRQIPLLFDFDASCIGNDCNSVQYTGSPKYATPVSKSIRGQEGFSINTKTYKYSPLYDRYSLAVLLGEDLIKLIPDTNKEDREEIKELADKDKAKILEEDALFQKQSVDAFQVNKKEGDNRMKGGSNCRIGIMNPTYGGKPKATRKRKTRKQKGKGCGCGSTPPKAPFMALPSEASMGPLTAALYKGGACPCALTPQIHTPMGGGYSAARSGGYRATKRNLKYLKLWKKGKSIGFTMRSSLKAKGLIPRANGTKRVSPKYR